MGGGNAVPEPTDEAGEKFDGLLVMLDTFNAEQLERLDEKAREFFDRSKWVADVTAMRYDHVDDWRTFGVLSTQEPFNDGGPFLIC